jgi:hypothetical protein
VRSKDSFSTTGASENVNRSRSQYVMLIYQGTALERQAALLEEEQKQVYADYQGINQTPGVTPGLPMGLPGNATTVRVEGGKTLTTDGPFVGMKEAVGGWFILEADDLDAAIEVAGGVSAATPSPVPHARIASVNERLVPCRQRAGKVPVGALLSGCGHGSRNRAGAQQAAAPADALRQRRPAL